MAISQTLCLCHSGKSKFPYSCQFGTKPTKYESLGTALNHQQGELPAAPYKIKSRHYYFPGEARPPSTRRAARNSKPYDAQAILPSAIDHVSSFQTRNFNAAEPFPSGTETHDMLERLCEGTYGFYESKRRGRRCATVDLAATAAEASSPDPATIAASTSSNTETPEAAAVSPSPTDPIAAAGFGETRSDMPEGWFPPYILLAAAWSPWSGPSTPAEWRNLDPSSGGCKRGRSRLEGEEEEEGGGGVAQNGEARESENAATRRNLVVDGDRPGSSGRRDQDSDGGGQSRCDVEGGGGVGGRGRAWSEREGEDGERIDVHEKTGGRGHAGGQ